ncbi:MEP50 [Mytilus edulis]|uniref:WDR77 n=1 Tax=Mytilus edulis TaxID=6550 RepID=A0A8S3RRX7_MYTED|nr:MEP50 [Mytilus edulis]
MIAYGPSKSGNQASGPSKSGNDSFWSIKIWNQLMNVSGALKSDDHCFWSTEIRRNDDFKLMATATRSRKRKRMQSPDDDLSMYKCPICLEIFADPVQISCGNNHTYCLQCVQSYQEIPTPQCPQCRQNFNPYQLQLDRHMIDSMQKIAPCKWCHKQMPIIQHKAHTAVCDMVDTSLPKFRPVKETSQPIPKDLPNRSTFSCPFCGEANLDTNGMVKHCNENHASESSNVKINKPLNVNKPGTENMCKQTFKCKHLLQKIYVFKCKHLLQKIYVNKPLNVNTCIKVWDVETLSSVHSFRGHYDIVECVRCHPLEPSMFLSCSQDNRILLWDTRKPRPASVVDSSPLENSPRSLAWQPQSKNMFAVGSSTGQIVFKDTRTSIGTPLSFTPHTRDVYKLEFCSDRPQLLASVSEDCTTVVTSLDTQKQVYRDCSHKDYVRGVSWMNDLQLYTCGWDSQVKLNNVVHLLSNKKESAENSVQMDVNGGSDDNSNAKQSTKEVKCNGNGVTIETGATDTKLDTT